MTRFRTAGLLTAVAMCCAPVWAQDADPPLSDEAATDIQVVDGVPVNPELRELLSQNPGKRSLEELIAASNDLLQQQQDQLAEQESAQDAEWMNDPFNHLEGEMHQLALHFEDGQTDRPVQEQGEEVVQKLDQLITLLEEMCES
ncbi:MAG: hypothetical protein ACIAXF_09155 [Phycisphaerales bacterium JB063]